MTDVREGEGGASDNPKRERPLDIMQKARLARGGRGAIEPVGQQVFSGQRCTHPENCEEHKQQPSLVLTHPVPYVTNALGAIGELTTRELLDELRLRGDMAMAIWPESQRGADGMVLNAMASVQLKSLSSSVLNAMRGQ